MSVYHDQHHTFAPVSAAQTIESAFPSSLHDHDTRPGSPTTPITTPPFSPPRYSSDDTHFVTQTYQPNHFSSAVAASLAALKHGMGRDPNSFSGDGRHAKAGFQAKKRTIRKKTPSTHASLTRRRRKTENRSAVMRNLNGFALQKLMATHYPDKIYGLSFTSAYRKVLTNGRGDVNMGDWLELTVEWGALSHAHKSTAARKKAPETIKTILPYSLMKKHYPEVLIWFYEERLRLYMPLSSADALSNSSSSSSLSPSSEDTNDSR